MGRYRKIDPRIWSDEKFSDFDPIQKLFWFTLLTHPLMTPMGAGVIYAGVLDEVIGNRGDWCWQCKDIGCKEHGAETLLETFKERSLIYCDKGLIVIKNYLAYNRSDNPNQMFSWVNSCEELPRSECFKELLEYLENLDDPLPEWMTHGLLIPLANQQNRTLTKHFWERVKPFLKNTDKVEANLDDKVKGKVKGKVEGNQEQYQEQYIGIKTNTKKTLNTLAETEKSSVSGSSSPKNGHAMTVSQPEKNDKIEFDKRTGGWKGITAEKKTLWSEAYPALNVDQELKKAVAWLLANPKNQKKNYERFLVNWFSKAQQKAPRIPEAKAYNGHDHERQEPAPLPDLPADFIAKNKAKAEKAVIEFWGAKSFQVTDKFSFGVHVDAELRRIYKDQHPP